MPRLAQYQRRSLALIRSRILLERAGINLTRDQIESIQEKPFCDEFRATDEIREAMELYVDTWILPVIDDLLAGKIPCDQEEGRAALSEWEKDYGKDA